MKNTVLEWLRSGKFVSAVWAFWELKRLDPIWFDEEHTKESINEALEEYLEEKANDKK